MKSKSSFFPVLSILHFYATMGLGWYYFADTVYPHYYFDPVHEVSVATALPMYVLNVAAFGALFYVATQPILLFLDGLISEIGDALARLGRNRG